MPIKNIKDISKENNKNTIAVIGEGILLAFVISILMIILYGILLAITPLSEATLTTAVMIITMASIALSSVYAAVKIESNGWLNGMIIGFIYMIILFFLGLLFKTNDGFNKYVLFRIFMGVVVGMLSGIIGINLK